MLEFRTYSDFDKFLIIYNKNGYDIGTLNKLKDKWVFLPSPNVDYYYQHYLEEINNKLKELNENL